jgi:hypothetical protein
MKIRKLVAAVSPGDPEVPKSSPGSPAAENLELRDNVDSQAACATTWPGASSIPVSVSVIISVSVINSVSA